MTSTAVFLRFSFLFIVGGVLEIAGGYLVWLWLREGRTLLHGLTGAIMLALFGVVLTFVPAYFGRAYAAYGGVFVVLSVLWSWAIDGRMPDSMDTLGAAIVLLGVGVMLAAPRG